MAHSGAKRGDLPIRGAVRGQVGGLDSGVLRRQVRGGGSAVAYSGDRYGGLTVAQPGDRYGRLGSGASRGQIREARQ